MGFFNSCWEALLQFVSISPFGGPGRPQYPLPLGPSHDLTVHPHHASPGFHCSYPGYEGWESCNGPNSRDCWIQRRGAKQPLWNSFNIKTEYEAMWPRGIKREYWLEVSDMKIAPDGYLKPFGKVFNGSYPGPLIEACWGDEIVVHVTNKLTTNGTTVHWHGIRQLHTNEMDGVNGVTQCPIAEYETFTYKFTASQYGHTWYHSHYSLQYPDGVAGPLLIHGPSSADWDEAWDPILISDWVHDSAFAVFQHELVPPPPISQSVLLNGTGRYLCNKSDPRCVCPQTDPHCVGPSSYFTKTFKKGKRYLLRLINASTDAGFIFSIDGHILKVISTDFVPIHPYTTNSLHIAIGQRYSVIVEATEPDTPARDGNYWIRTQVPTGCGNIDPNGSDERTGIIRYNSASTPLPSSTKNQFPSNCTDEPYESLKPIVEWLVQHPENNVTENTYEAGIDLDKTHGYQRWDLTDTPLWLNFSNPTILNLKNTTWNPEYCVIPYDYKHGWVYLVITGDLTRLEKTKRRIPAAHPIHMHGHDFVILAQSNNTYNESVDPQHFNFHNPPRRDVAFLPSAGYLALAFKPDNPGIWLVHCHIAWHASSGLALQILERQEDILSSIGTLSKTKKTCNGWEEWLKTTKVKFDQDDSGI